MSFFCRGEIGVIMKKQTKYIIILLLLILILTVTYLLQAQFLTIRLLIYKLAFLIIGTISLVMTLRYVLISQKAKKMPYKSTAKVLEVVKDTGFNSSYAIGRSVSPGSGFFEQGQGGSWQLFFMLWNEIRPDHWFPKLQVKTEDSRLQNTTFAYGGLKRDWTVGEELSVAWQNAESEIVYPISPKWLYKKAIVYSILGIFLLSLGVIHFSRIIEVCSSDEVPLLHTISEVLYGYPEIYDGSEEKTADTIQLIFHKFDGEKEYMLPLSKGDQLDIIMEDFSSDKQNLYTNNVMQLTDVSGSLTTAGILRPADADVTKDYRQFTYTIPKDATYKITLKGRGSEGTISIKFNQVQ